MGERDDHYHRCPSPECDATWICSRVNCGTDDLCDACERRQFEAYHEAHGFTVSQPELVEVEKD